jgi:hypothetical protein
MRPGQHNNKNRNRNRNRRHGGGGGGGGGGGHGANRVYDSNGPDVKLRGTAQTVAEKYMQLGRDAQSSGDTVMAESYYQHGDHYYRIWLAAQPAGQPLQFSRRLAEEEFEDEGGGDEQAEGQDGETVEAEGGEPVEGAVAAEGSEGQGDGEGQQQNFRPRQDNREFRNRDNRDNREGGNRFRQRWPRRNDRYNNGGEPNGNGPEGEGGERQEQRFERNDRPDRNNRPERAVEEQVEGNGGDAGAWEAPSFLTRPAPAAVEGEAPEQPRPRGRRPRAAEPVEDAPQGE